MHTFTTMSLKSLYKTKSFQLGALQKSCCSNYSNPTTHSPPKAQPDKVQKWIFQTEQLNSVTGMNEGGKMDGWMEVSSHSFLPGNSSLYLLLDLNMSWEACFWPIPTQCYPYMFGFRLVCVDYILSLIAFDSLDVSFFFFYNIFTFSPSGFLGSLYIWRGLTAESEQNQSKVVLLYHDRGQISDRDYII